MHDTSLVNKTYQAVLSTQSLEGVSHVMLCSRRVLPIILYIYLPLMLYEQAPPSKLQLHNIDHLHSLYWTAIPGRLSLPDDFLDVNLIWLQHLHSQATPD